MWQKWAVAEGLAKTANGLVQKLVGLSGGGLGAASLAHVVSGLVQMVGGLSGARGNLYPGYRAILPAVIFGLFATGMTVLGIYTFELGADLGVRTLIVVSSIVPGTLLGKILFDDPLGLRQWFGIILFMIAVWSMLGFPASIPTDAWIWITVAIALLGAANEVCARYASSTMDPWQNSVWIGGSIVVWSTIGVVIWGLPSTRTLTFWHGALLLGIISFGMIVFKLLAYGIGGKTATINLKKLIMQSTYLVTVTALGIMLYNEPLTAGKIVGTVLFLVAYAVTDKEASRFFERTAAAR